MRSTARNAGAGKAEQEKPEQSDGGAGRLDSLWRGVLLLVAIVLLVGGGREWFSPIPITTEVTIEKTQKDALGAVTSTAKTRDQRTTNDKTVKETTKIKGRRSQNSEAEPAGAGARSETITIALLTAGLAVLLLAAIGRVPAKVSGGAFSAEFPTLPVEAAAKLAVEASASPEHVPVELARQAALEMAWKAQMSGAFSAYATSEVARREDRLTDPGRSRRGDPDYPTVEASPLTSPGDDYWGRLARRALRSARQGDDDPPA